MEITVISTRKDSSFSYNMRLWPAKAGPLGPPHPQDSELLSFFSAMLFARFPSLRARWGYKMIIPKFQANGKKEEN